MNKQEAIVASAVTIKSADFQPITKNLGEVELQDQMDTRRTLLRAENDVQEKEPCGTVNVSGEVPSDVSYGTEIFKDSLESRKFMKERKNKQTEEDIAALKVYEEEEKKIRVTKAKIACKIMDEADISKLQDDQEYGQRTPMADSDKEMIGQQMDLVVVDNVHHYQICIVLSSKKEKTKEPDTACGDSKDESDLFLLVNQVNVEKQELKDTSSMIKLNFKQYGSRPLYQTSKCWKQYREYIYFFVAETENVVRLEKLNLKTLKQENVNTFDLSGKEIEIFDIQFSDSTKEADGGWKFNQDIDDQEQWLRSQYVAFIVGTKQTFKYGQPQLESKPTKFFRQNAGVKRRSTLKNSLILDDEKGGHQKAKIQIYTTNLANKVTQEIFQYSDIYQSYEDLHTKWACVIRQTGQNLENLLFATNDDQHKFFIVDSQKVDLDIEIIPDLKKSIYKTVLKLVENEELARDIQNHMKSTSSSKVYKIFPHTLKWQYQEKHTDQNCLPIALQIEDTSRKQLFTISIISSGVFNLSKTEIFRPSKENLELDFQIKDIDESESQFSTDQWQKVDEDDDLEDIHLELKDKQKQLMLDQQEIKIIPLKFLHLYNHIKINTKQPPPFDGRNHQCQLDSVVQFCLCSKISGDSTLTQDINIVLRIDRVNSTILICQRMRYDQHNMKLPNLIGQSVFISKQKIPTKEWMVLPLKEFKQHRAISGFSVWSKGGRDEGDGWSEFATFRNFKESDFLIRTEIGYAGYKFYDDDPSFDQYGEKDLQGLLLETRLNPDLSKKNKYSENLEILQIFTQNLANMIPIIGIEQPLTKFEKLMNDCQYDFLQPVELFIGKSLASFMDSNNIKNFIDAKIQKEQKQEVGEDKHQEKPLQHSSIFEHFAGRDEGLIAFGNDVGFGRRQFYESSEDFFIQSAIQDKLESNDVQSFKLLFEVLQTQENKIGAYKIVMKMLPQIVYFQTQFAPEIAEFFNEGENEVTFGMRAITAKTIIPQFDSKVTIRSFPDEDEDFVQEPKNDWRYDMAKQVRAYFNWNKDDKIKTDRKYLDEIEEGENSMNLTDDMIKKQAKIRKHIISRSDIKNKKKAPDPDQKQIAVEHFTIDFGNFKLENRLKVIKHKDEDAEQTALLKKFEKINDYLLSDFMEKLNDHYYMHIDSMTCVKHFVDYQFVQTRRFYLSIIFFYLIFYALPIGYAFQKDLFDLWLLFFPLVMFILLVWFELIQIREDGIMDYLNQASNWIDIFGHLCNLVLFNIMLRTGQVYSFHRNLDLYVYVKSCIILIALAKFSFYLRVDEQFGLLVMLVRDCFVTVIPFFIFLMLWLQAFEMLYDALGCQANDFVGLTANSWLAFWLKTWSNSIGNVSQPIFDPSWNDNNLLIRVYLIYFLWWLNQFIVLIVLLNFLIAIISQSYENVMDSKLISRYQDMTDLSREAYQIMRYIPTFGQFRSRTIIMTVPKYSSEEEGQWGGFVQAIKNFIQKKLNHVSRKQIETTKDEIRNSEKRLQNKIDKVSDELKNSQAQIQNSFSEINYMAQNIQKVLQICQSLQNPFQEEEKYHDMSVSQSFAPINQI